MSRSMKQLGVSLKSKQSSETLSNCPVKRDCRMLMGTMSRLSNFHKKKFIIVILVFVFSPVPIYVML